ncbi:Leucine rich repeat variant [Lentzea waywayandensis]|uniref:Leucine rich repeat variant n=1 Tax=Lentzea waywayandensis TaxID=84724 RepID=A0A1I6FCM6_9PSEU|nr:hypothetical protein [Lentzea waywayandensis]SFR27668.1 Leucine rich repeat variant [Lentzea waywayandensis]
MHLQMALEGLALNPALPEGMIRRLIAHRQGPDEIGKRPDLTAGLIDEMIAADRPRLLRSLALNDGLPDSFRLRLARHPDVSVRARVAMSCDQGTSREVFELLLADPEPTTREYLAGNAAMPDDLRARLATDPSDKVREALARHWPAAPEHVRRTLLTDVEDEVREAACSDHHPRLPRPVPPPDLIPALLADPVTRVGVIRHLTLDEPTARRLSQDPDADVRVEVAKHPQLPSELRDALSTDPNALVRLAVFGREDTPAPLRSAIHAQLLTGPHSLGFGGEDGARIERMLVLGELQMLRLDWVCADPLPHVDSPYPCFRVSAASSEQPLPPEVVARLLADDEYDVRSTMARRAPHLVDAVTAERIDREFSPSSAKFTPWRPADELTFPAEVLRRFATDPDPRMRCLAPRDPDLPAGIATRLAADPDAEVRYAVAGHRNLPVEALIALLDDVDERTVHAAAASPRLPEARMERLLVLAGL